MFESKISKGYIDLFKIIEQSGYILPTVTDMIISLIESSTIYIVPHTDSTNGMYYDQLNDKIYFSNFDWISQRLGSNIKYLFYKIWDGDEEAAKEVTKVFKPFIAGIMYAGIHLYNKNVYHSQELSAHLMHKNHFQHDLSLH